MDGNLGGVLGIVGFVGLLAFLIAAFAGFLALFFCLGDRSFRGEPARVLRTSSRIALFYLAAVVLVSLLTPRTIVSIGDGYCWDLWCMGVEQVNATPRGESTLYTANIRIFSDANRVPNSRAKDFLYVVVDEQGRRFPVFQDSSAPAPLDVTVYPKQSVKTSLSFLAPAKSRNLYLTGDHVAMPWVYFYFGSHVNPFHRRTLLRIF